MNAIESKVKSKRIESPRKVNVIESKVNVIEPKVNVIESKEKVSKEEDQLESEVSETLTLLHLPNLFNVKKWTDRSLNLFLKLDLSVDTKVTVVVLKYWLRMFGFGTGVNKPQLVKMLLDPQLKLKGSGWKSVGTESGDVDGEEDDLGDEEEGDDDDEEEDDDLGDEEEGDDDDSKYDDLGKDEEEDGDSEWDDEDEKGKVKDQGQELTMKKYQEGIMLDKQ